MSLPSEELSTDYINQVLKELQANPGEFSSKKLLEATMNLIMQAERNLHLKNNPNDKGNGYLKRQLGTPCGKLDVAVPRDRDGDFRPEILPSPYQRDTRDRYQLLQSLLINSYSPNMIARTLHELDLSYSPDELKQLKEELHTEFEQWQSRELDHDIIALYIDVYHAEALIDGHVKKIAIHVLIGIDFDGVKDLYGLYVCQGNENKAHWLQVLNKLIDRGLKRPLMVLSDNFSGLKDAVQTLFPKTLHQLCFIHMQRNVYKHMGNEAGAEFNEELKRIRFEKDYNTCIKQFDTLCEAYLDKNICNSFINSLQKDKVHYFVHAKLPGPIRKYFYTTNIVESANSMLEKMRVRMGGFFQSEEALQVNVYITFRSLRMRKWKYGLPKLKPHLYQLRQLFAQVYDEQPKH